MVYSISKFSRHSENELLNSKDFLASVYDKNWITIYAKDTEDIRLSCQDAHSYSGGWACFYLNEVLSFNTYGILNKCLSPLAQGGISVLVLSLYDTDYIFLRNEQANKAIELWRNSGHNVDDEAA
jgi:hypothetical protein